MFWIQKIIIFIFCVFKVLQCMWQNFRHGQNLRSEDVPTQDTARLAWSNCLMIPFGHIIDMGYS